MPAKPFAGADLSAHWTDQRSTADIAAHYRVSLATIWRAAGRLGLPRKATIRWARQLSPVRAAWLCARWPVYPPATLAQYLRCSVSSVRRFAAQLNLPPHRPGPRPRMPRPRVVPAPTPSKAPPATRRPSRTDKAGTLAGATKWRCACGRLNALEPDERTGKQVRMGCRHPSLQESLEAVNARVRAECRELRLREADPVKFSC